MACVCVCVSPLDVIEMPPRIYNSFQPRLSLRQGQCDGFLLFLHHLRSIYFDKAMLAI